MIIVRTLRRDIAQYNREDDDLEDAIEETGWKLVHGDVFRPPKNVKKNLKNFLLQLKVFFFTFINVLSKTFKNR